MGEENSKCACFISNEEKHTAKFDKDGQSNVINGNPIITNHQLHNKEERQSNSETNSFKDLKTYITFKNAGDSMSNPVASSDKEKEKANDQLISTNVKKHTSILVHQALKKEEPPNPNPQDEEKTAQTSTGVKSRKLGYHKSLSVNPFSGLKKEVLINGQKLFRGFSYRKKYKKIKQEQIDYTLQLIKELYTKYVTQKVIDMEASIGIKNDKNRWKTLTKQSSIGVGSVLVNELRLYARLKIFQGANEGFYVGEVNLNNQMSGKGVLIKSNGSKFEGTWANNKFNGIGRLIDAEGSLYEGFFIDGKLNGNGTKKTLDGVIYVGDFKNHLKEGKGKEESKETSYEGSFLHDHKNGKGTLIYKLLNDEYEGNFIENTITGEGKYKWNNKETYQGTFKNGKMDGRGLFKWADGGEYEGEYVNNIKEGKGRYKWNNGKVYTGSFKKGKPWGEGILCVKSKEYQVKFKDGKIVGKLREIKKDKPKNNDNNEEEEDNSFYEDGPPQDNKLFHFKNQNITLKAKDKDDSSSNDSSSIR